MKIAWWLFLGLFLLALSGCNQLGGSSSEDEPKVSKDDDEEETPKKKKKKKKKKADDDEEAEDDDEPDKTADAKPAVTGVAPPPVAAAPPPPAAVVPPPEPAPPPVVAAPPPGGRSAVPTLDEWNAVTKEVAVRGSSKLNCETKMVREWLRVSCRGKNDFRGEPTGVELTRGGGRGDEFLFKGTAVTSLVVRFVEGVDLDVFFTFTRGSYQLKVFWPRGAPEPQAKGEFLGV